MLVSARRLGLVASLVVFVVSCSTVWTVSAFAKVGYIPVGSFSLPEGRAFGIGVDNSSGPLKGDLYVSDRVSDKLYELSSSGSVLAEASLPGVTLGQLSVAESGAYAGDVYVAGESNGVVYRFAPGLGSREELVTGLQSPSDVAVDAAGDVFVSEYLKMDVLEYNSAGQPVDASGVPVVSGENVVAEPKLTISPSGQEVPVLAAVAVSQSGTALYAAARYDEYVAGERDTPQGGEILGYSLSAGSYTQTGLAYEDNRDGGVAASSAGYVYTDTTQNMVVIESSGESIDTVGAESLSFFPGGVALDSESGDVYLADAGNESGRVFVFEGGERAAAATEPFTGLDGSSVTLNGTVSGETGYYFEYNLGSSCTGFESHRTSLVAASGTVSVHAELRGLARLSKYSYCLVAVNKYGAESGASMPLETGQVQPRISGESVSSVASQTATVTAQVNPEGLPLTYYFEYGSSSGTGYELKTGQSSVPAGEASVSVRASLTGLVPGASYRVRLVAVNSVGASDGAGVTFATYPSALGGLPDERVYEMVSPAYNPFDMDVYETDAGSLFTELPFESSLDGNTVVYAGLPSSGGTGSSGLEAGDEYRATRSPQGGWSQENVTPVGGLAFVHYSGFTSDLSSGVVSTSQPAPLHTVASFVNPVEDNGSESYEDVYETSFKEGLLRPMFSSLPAYRTAAGEAGFITDRLESKFAGATPDFNSILFEANDDLLEGTGSLEAELASTEKKESEAVDAALTLEREGQAEKNEATIIKAIEMYASAYNFNLYDSVDGRLSLVNVLPNGKQAVGAVFGSPSPESYPLSQKTYASKAVGNRSNVISVDGSRVFWSSVTTIKGYSDVSGIVYVREDGSRTVQVSAGAAVYWTASPDGRYAYYVEKGELWRFDVQSETREAVAPGSETFVRGVLGVNQSGADGAYVYFVALGDLTGGENAEGQKPESSEPNLYVSEPDPSHPGGHVTRFIATLSSEDTADWGRIPGRRTAQVAPDGRSVVFLSTANLTGHPYPNEGAEEVYDYRVADGRLFCVSCRPQASGGTLAASGSPVSTRRWVSEDGDRVFFESEAPLVERDVNGARDVYEWEPNGAGACTEVEGCVYLLSKGLEGSAFFADASANGDDVFIATRQRLAPEDQNEMVDLYDARVDGARPVLPPECVGSGCQGAPAAAPIFATPSSETFNGVGNFSPVTAARPMKVKRLTRAQKLARALAACHRKRSREHKRSCEAGARKLYSPRTGKHTTTKAR